MGAGGNQSSSNTATNSDSLSISEAISQSFGINASQGSSAQSAQTFVDPRQQGFLTSLRQDASQFADPNAASRAVMPTVQMNQRGLQGAQRTLAGLQDTRGQIAAQSASLEAGLGRLFSEQINPQISSEAIAAGGLGGGRQGVAQGVAAGQLGSVFAENLGNIIAGANNQAMQAASQVGSLVNPALLNATAPQAAGMDVLSQLAGILGGPTVLSRSSGSSSQSSQGRTGSQSIAASQSQSQSRSRGQSKSGGFSFRLI